MKATKEVNKFTLSMLDMLDLFSSTFIVPIIDRYSPVAYSIINFTHWNHLVAKQNGLELVYRYARHIVYIIDGQDLVRSIRKNCLICRYLSKRSNRFKWVKYLSTDSIPPFYSTPVDLCGLFSAYSNFNKRKTLKICLVVFCCTTTLNIDIRNKNTCNGRLQFIRINHKKFQASFETWQVHGPRLMHRPKWFKNERISKQEISFCLLNVRMHFRVRINTRAR